jgi:YrhK-like protein
VGTRRASWWIGVLFSIGSVCFLVGPFPGFADLVGSTADGAVFFVGSIFFTSAALLQYLETANADRELGEHARRRLRLLTFEPDKIDWWSALIQLVGTLFFNVDTYRAMQASIDTSSVDRLVWAPDAVGSLCFLISGVMAYLQVRHGGLLRAKHTRKWRIAAVNLLGCIFFAMAAVASYVVPDTGDLLDPAAANVTTSLGALCFLIGAVLLLPEAGSTHDDSSQPGDSPVEVIAETPS